MFDDIVVDFNGLREITEIYEEMAGFATGEEVTVDWFDIKIGCWESNTPMQLVQV